MEAALKLIVDHAVSLYEKKAISGITMYHPWAKSRYHQQQP
jgi:hypothetical protein